MRFIISLLAAVWLLSNPLSPARAIEWSDIVASAKEDWEATDRAYRHMRGLLTFQGDAREGGNVVVALSGEMAISTDSAGSLFHTIKENPPNPLGGTGVLVAKNNRYGFRISQLDPNSKWTLLNAELANDKSSIAARLDRTWQTNIEYWHPLHIGSLNLLSLIQSPEFEVIRSSDSDDGNIVVTFKVNSQNPNDFKGLIEGDFTLSPPLQYAIVAATFRRSVATEPPTTNTTKFTFDCGLVDDQLVRKQFKSVTIPDGGNRVDTISTTFQDVVFSDRQQSAGYYLPHYGIAEPAELRTNNLPYWLIAFAVVFLMTGFAIFYLKRRAK